MVQSPAPISNQPPQVQYQEDYFIYGVDFPSIAANGSSDANIQIEADSYFKWIKGTFFAFITGQDPAETDSTRNVPPLRIQITDSGSGRQLYNIPINVNSGFGTGVLPFILPIPRIFLPRSNIAFTAQNDSSANSWELSLALIGVKGFEG